MGGCTCQNIVKTSLKCCMNINQITYQGNILPINSIFLGRCQKVIDLLKEDGCDIKSINHKGHQLNSLPDQWYSGIVKPILDELGLLII